MTRELPIACTLEPDALAERRAAWAAVTGAALRGRAEIAGGVRLVFDGAAEPELRSLAALEADCCSFATWTVTRQGAEAVLDVEAAPEQADAVRAMFAAPAA
jgi:hypothetical protein